MSLVRSSVLAGAIAGALVATSVAPGLAQGEANAAAPGQEDAGSVQSLALTVDTAETERGTGDTGTTGLSKGDTYVSNGTLRDAAGEAVGTYHVACTITDEKDDQDSAWSMCSTATVIDGRGTLLASGVSELLQVETSGNGFGVAPPQAEFAIVGGTGMYAGAVGQVTSTRDASMRKLSYRFTIEGL